MLYDEIEVKAEKKEETKKARSKKKMKKGVIVDAVMVNLRCEPSFSSNVAVVLMNNADVDIDPEFKNDDWYKAKSTTGVDGYICKKFVAIKE